MLDKGGAAPYNVGMNAILDGRPKGGAATEALAEGVLALAKGGAAVSLLLKRDPGDPPEYDFARRVTDDLAGLGMVAAVESECPAGGGWTAFVLRPIPKNPKYGA